MVTVTVCDALVVPTVRDAKVRLPGATVGSATDVPLAAIDCGELTALSHNLSVIDSKVPAAAVGVKVTVMVQDAATARLPMQLLVWVKSLTKVPTRLTPFIKIGAVPVFLTVTLSVELVLRLTLLKLRLLGLMLSGCGTGVGEGDASGAL